MMSLLALPASSSPSRSERSDRRLSGAPARPLSPNKSDSCRQVCQARQACKRPGISAPLCRSSFTHSSPAPSLRPRLADPAQQSSLGSGSGGSSHKADSSTNSSGSSSLHTLTPNRSIDTDPMTHVMSISDSLPKWGL
jgi:hypothetical protein